MTDTVRCQYLNEELEALERAPYPGEIGERIQANISKAGWQEWLKHQTMLINEHHLSPINPEHRKYLEEQMIRFLFEGGADRPEGYTPPE